MKDLGNLTNWDKEDLLWKESTNTSTCMRMNTLMLTRTSIPTTARRTAMSIPMFMGTSTCTNISMSTPMADRPNYTTMTTRATTAPMTMTILAMKRNPMLTPTEILIL